MRLLDLCRNLSAANSSALSDLVRYVVGICSKPKVGRIAARRVVAGVKAMKVGRDRPVAQLVREPMRSRDFAINLQAAIPAVQMPLPFPAVIWPADIYPTPKPIFCGLVLNFTAMSVNKLNRLPNYMTMPTIIPSSHRCELAAATHAQAARIGAFGWSKFQVMVVNEPKRLTLDRAAFGPCRRCNLGFAAATAVAVAVWDFVRGIMGLHQKYLSGVMPQGVDRTAAAPFIGLLIGSIIPQVGQ